MNKEILKEDEIDLVALLGSLYQSRKLIVLSTVVFMLLGLLVALLSPVTYKAETTFVPQTSEKGGVSSSLSGLAALAGVNLGGVDSANQIPPSLYPTIFESDSFKKDFLNAEITDYMGEKLTVKEYLLQGSSGPGIISRIKNSLLGGSTDSADLNIKTSNFLHLDKDEYGLSKALEDLLVVTTNDKEGFVSMSMIDKDPYMAAELVQKAYGLLESTVIDFKIKNAKKLYDFVSEQYLIKQKEFEAIQKQLALFSDRNKNITTAVFDSERQRLQTKYDLSFALYQELAKQKAQAELQLSKDTPIFSIIKPVVVPKEKDAPKRALILVIYTFLGAVLSVGYVLVKGPIKEITRQITQ